MKLLRLFLLGSLLHLYGQAVLGQTGELQGKVTDQASGEGTPFANVILMVDKVMKGGAVTDFEGNYCIKPIEPGTYDVKVSYVGYDINLTKDVVVDAGKITFLNITMKAGAVTLDEISVVETKVPLISRAATTASRVIAPKSIETIPARTARSVSSRIGSKAKKTASSSIDGLKRKVKDKGSKLVKSVPDPRKRGLDPAEAADDQRRQAGLLTAGRWKDLGNWKFYLKLMDKPSWASKETYWGFHPRQRYSVYVHSHGVPQTDVNVKLAAMNNEVVWEAKTNNRGYAELFANMFDRDGKLFKVIVEDFEEERIIRTSDPCCQLLEIDLKSAYRFHHNVDIMFVTDATGSMGDEMEYLKVELKDVIRKVQALNEQLDMRLSCNFYRDVGDEFVVRSNPFTSNIDESIDILKAQRAGGGGDYEEAVEQALEDAIRDHHWSMTAQARLLFLVLDAPPHHNQQSVAMIQGLAEEAAQKGITIIPVASSGVNKDTEFLLRFLSMATNGEYVFLTNHSGIGNSHIEPTIGSYDVEYLNELLVNLIHEYIRVNDKS